jgi:heterodisulfide reductase subunit C
MAEFAKDIEAPASRDSAWEPKLLGFKDLKLLRLCMQCGTCSGSCGVAPLADYTPRMIVNLVARGDVKLALQSKMIFLCTNCLACTTRCPKGIPVADLMMKLRNLSIAAGIADLEDRASAEEFVKNVLKRGRVYEPEMMIRYAMRTSPLSLLSMRGAALSLFKHGKLGLPAKSMTSLEDLKRKFKEGG